jgi:hypothetical protein
MGMIIIHREDDLDASFDLISKNLIQIGMFLPFRADEYFNNNLVAFLDNYC